MHNSQVQFYYLPPRLGVSGVVLETLKSYLRDRQQSVSVNGATSSMKPLRFGVPQGSVLGPLLFLVMINDLDMDWKTLLFADDTTLISKAHGPMVALNESNALFLRALNWFINNRLKINEDKTQNLLFTLATGEQDGSAVKLLGFQIDSKLTWAEHTTAVSKKLSKVVYLLRKLKKLVPDHFLRGAYFALFHSHVSYGILLWGHSAGVRDVLLQQKKAVRILTSSPYRAHCKPLFTSVEILTVYGQYILDSLIEAKINPGPSRDRTHGHNTRAACNIDIPRCRLNISRDSHPLMGFKLFNKIPFAVRELPLSIFKVFVKKKLINSPPYSLVEFNPSSWTV